MEVPTARILLLFFCANFANCLKVKEQAIQKNLEKCAELARNPYFDMDLVVGKSWRIYYSWNVKMEDKCLDLTFRNATLMIVNRIYHDMYEYLETQPNWNAATLYLSLGKAKHEVLLLADQGPAGSFVGVSNVVRDGNITPLRRAVPLLKFFIKLLHDGTVLLMSDCNIGVTTLSSRERPPFRSELAAVANSLPLDTGDMACIADKKKDEQMYLR